MNENYIVINGKRAELTEEQLKKLGIEIPKNQRGRVDEHHLYYFVDHNNLVLSTNDIYDAADDYRYYSHNYFKTKEDAEKYTRVLETEILLRQYADEHNEDIPWDGCAQHWSIYGDHAIKFECWYSFKFPRAIYFSSEEIAKAAVQEIGEERMIEYLTYKW